MPPPRGLERQVAGQQSAILMERQRREMERLNRLQAEYSNRQFRTDREHSQYLDRMESQMERVSALEQRAADARERSMSSMQRGMRNVAATARDAFSSRVSQGIDHVFQSVIAGATRAQQALLQTHRSVMPTVADYGVALANYEKMTAAATQSALRYGFSMDEVTEAQHRFVQSMNIDVAAGGFADRVADMADTMGYLAVRTGQSINEVEQFSSAALSTFGRGGESQIESYARTMRALVQIPSIMADEMVGAGEEVGNVFANPAFMNMVQEWTTQFGDQAANIAEMATAMGLFQKNLVAAGHSTRSVNNITGALVQGIQGQRGWNANTLMAGQRLQARIRQDPNFINEVDRRSRERGGAGLADADRRIIQQLAAGDSGVNAADLFHMLKGTAAGMDAFMESMVGLDTGNISITKQMLTEQGIDTGNDADQLRLADLITQRGQGNMVDEAEIGRLLEQATQTSQDNQRAQLDQYRNIGVTADAAARTAELMQTLTNNVVQNLPQILQRITTGAGTAGGIASAMGLGGAAASGGGAAAAGAGAIGVGGALGATGAGIASFAATTALVDALTDGEASEAQRLLMSDDFSILGAGDTARSIVPLRPGMNAQDQSGAVSSILNRIGSWNEEYDVLDIEDDEADRQAIIRQLTEAQQSLSPENYRRVLEGMRGQGIDTEGMTEEVQRQRELLGRIGSQYEATTPITVPNAAMQPVPTRIPMPTEPVGDQGAINPNTGTPADPLRPARPGTMQLAQNGQATISLQFNVRDFNVAVGRANLQNSNAAPTGAGAVLG